MGFILVLDFSRPFPVLYWPGWPAGVWADEDLCKQNASWMKFYLVCDFYGDGVYHAFFSEAFKVFAQ